MCRYTHIYTHTAHYRVLSLWGPRDAEETL